MDLIVQPRPIPYFFSSGSDCYAIIQVCPPVWMMHDTVAAHFIYAYRQQVKLAY